MGTVTTCGTCGCQITDANGIADKRYRSGFRGTCRSCASEKQRQNRLALAQQPDEDDDERPDIRGKRARKTEFAPRMSDTYHFEEYVRGESDREDYLLATKTASSYFNYPLGLYIEAVDKDSHLASVLEQRKTGVLQLPWDILPADASPEAEDAAEFVHQALDNISIGQGDAGFHRDLADCLDAVAYGFAVSELIWGDKELLIPDKTKTKSKKFKAYIPTQIKSRHPRRFIFDKYGQCKLLTKENGQGVELPPFKFMIYRPLAQFENPYGTPIIRRVWWLCWIKRHVYQFWFKFTETYGDPVAIAKLTTELTPADRASLLEALNNMQQETGIVPPAGVEVLFREPSRYSSITTYQQLIDNINREISKAIMGQHMTTEAPTKGARSLGEVQERVARWLVLNDALTLEALINGDLIPMLMMFSKPGAPTPRFEFNKDLIDDQAAAIEVDKGLQDIGFGLSKTETMKRYGRRPAQDGDDKLEKWVDPTPKFGEGPAGPKGDKAGKAA